MAAGKTAPIIPHHALPLHGTLPSLKWEGFFLGQNMKKEIDSKEIAQVAAALMVSNAKSAVKYIDNKTVVRATWHDKPSNRNAQEVMIVTIGRPNYREAKFVAKCALNCIKLPSNPVLKAWPKKK